MSVTVTIPEGLQYVAGSLLTTVFLLVGQNSVVSRHRKAAGIAYPQMYAEQSQAEKSDAALRFNCAQRAHQNTLENIPIMLITTLISGLKFPIPTAAALMVWNISRISYTRGYITGDPKKRVSAVYLSGSLAALGLLGSSVFAVGGWILAGCK